MKFDMQRTKLEKPTLPNQPRYRVTVTIREVEETYELNYEELVGQPYGDKYNDIEINPDNAEALLAQSLEEYGGTAATGVLMSLEDWSMIPKDFMVEVTAVRIDNEA